MTTTDHATAPALAAARDADKRSGRDYGSIVLGLMAAALVLGIEVAVVAALWMSYTAVF